MIVGFTGTQRGMTRVQREQVRHLLVDLNVSSLHLGDCIGADVDCHQIAIDLLGHPALVCHPPIKESKRAFLKYTVVLEAKEYLDRNKDIVDQSHVLIAAPQSAFEEVRSGTWSTVRYARKMMKPIFIVYPNGEIKRENDALLPNETDH